MRLHPNTIMRIAGIDGKIHVQELVQGQHDFIRFSLTTEAGQVLTPTITATVQQKTVTSITDSARGLDVEFTRASKKSQPINLPVTVDTNGLVTVPIGDEIYSTISLEPLEVCFLTGAIKMEFTATTIEPAFTEFLFLAFVVRDDQVETI